MRRAPRRDLATFLRYTRVLVWEFRATLVGLVVCLSLGAALYAVTPMSSLGGKRPSLMLAALAAWMHLFGEPVLGPSETWYILLVSGLYPLVGFTLIAEGVVRFALLMLSRRRGEKEWMKVKASTFRDHVILCGLGHLGFRVLGQLLAQGRQVVCIEKDANGRFVEEAKSTDAPILVRDMKEDAALEEAGVRHAQAILICTNDDLANLEVALDCRRMNPKIRIVMRQYDQQMATKFREAFSIDHAFSSSALSAATVAAMALPAKVLASFRLGGVPFVTARVTLLRRSPLIGRTIAQVEAQHSAQVLSRERGERAETPPNATAVLEEGDLLVVLARTTDIGAVAQSGGGEIVEPISFLVATGLVTLGLGTVGYLQMKKKQQQLALAWAACAEQLGGTFTSAETKFWNPAPARVVATVAPGVEVTVDHYTVSTGKSTVTYTRLVARAAGAGALKIKLSAEGVMASVGKALGMGDLLLGDPAFDERFLVRTGDAELARAWLAEPARQALLGAATSYAMVLEGGEVKAQKVGLELETAPLVAAIQAVAALAGGGIVLLAEWRKLATELGGRLVAPHFVPGEVRFEGELDGRQLTIEVAVEGTRVRRDLGVRDAPPIDLAKGEPLATIPEAARLFHGPSAESDWQSLQPARLACDGESVVLSWAGYLPDAKRLRAAARLLAAVETGPYR